jgi:hypothetical protein
MFEYDYTRELVNNLWNIDNIDIPETLAEVLEVNFPALPFAISCDGAAVKIKFIQELTPLEKTQLDLVVSNYKIGLIL